MSKRMASPSRTTRASNEERNNSFIVTPSRREPLNRSMLSGSVDRRNSLYQSDNTSNYDNPSPTRFDYSIPMPSGTRQSLGARNSPSKASSLERATEIINKMRTLPANGHNNAHAHHNFEPTPRSVSVTGHYSEPNQRSASVASHYSEPVHKSVPVPNHYNDRQFIKDDPSSRKRRIISDQYGMNDSNPHKGTADVDEYEAGFEDATLDSNVSGNEVMYLITKMYREMREAHENTHKMTMELKYHVEEQSILMKRLIRENYQLREDIKRLR
ncbi:hypothetical protein NADFUDRAFT_43647 [Nadsonia fulvescens var. elongata DSM 6958]|uniref:Uncharacterized protein n=1 Tax=Nadsonia fulvescens var. elongata DSM 6958 TaxID=857566 RepID=A0A1E3PF04_9ASCO|nr:hypothetical protein NADFUDRAFT_43647 [Nadsonia fulvescens var. elongata DSM 6958]